jgi:hypothetical protein
VDVEESLSVSFLYRRKRAFPMDLNFPAVFYALNGRVPSFQKCLTCFDLNNAIPQLGSVETKELETQLVNAIRASVLDAVDGIENVFLSLSAGYDSVAILGVLKESGKKVNTFTYGSARPPKWSDVDIARETANRLGFPHRIWPMDGYDVSELQAGNAQFFDYRANRCGELGAWFFFRDNIQPVIDCAPLFLFGDECFGWNDCKIKNERDLMAAIALSPSVSCIEPFVKPELVDFLRDRYSAELADIAAKASHLEDWHDKKDFLYFHERIQSVILPWRDCFANRFGNAATPLLDRRVLEVVSKLPTKERKGKRLMKRAVKRAFPYAFSSKRAVRSGAPQLSVLAPWPKSFNKAEIKEVCCEMGLVPDVVDLIEMRASATSNVASDNSGSQALKAMVKTTLKDTRVGNFIRANSSPPFSPPGLDIMLSRLQVWILRSLTVKQTIPDFTTANGGAL